MGVATRALLFGLYIRSPIRALMFFLESTIYEIAVLLKCIRYLLLTRKVDQDVDQVPRVWVPWVTLTAAL